jgi:hypothetical protein
MVSKVYLRYPSVLVASSYLRSISISVKSEIDMHSKNDWLSEETYLLVTRGILQHKTK